MLIIMKAKVFLPEALVTLAYSGISYLVCTKLDIYMSMLYSIIISVYTIKDYTIKSFSKKKSYTFF